MRFRLVTYNIHKGIGGTDRRYRLQRIVETLRHCEPDITFLQEVDEGVPRSHFDRQVEILAAALDLPYQAYQKNVKLKRGHYGNAILSRFPLLEVANFDLTIPLKKRRQALVARCELHKGGHTRQLVLGNAHLGLAGIERLIQLRRLLNCERIETISEDDPIVVGGDFNDGRDILGKRILRPGSFESAGRQIRTFPAAFPLRALDRLFYRGPLKLHGAHACRTKLARQASDHLPLVADFEILPPSRESHSGERG